MYFHPIFYNFHSFKKIFIQKTFMVSAHNHVCKCRTASFRCAVYYFVHKSFLNESDRPFIFLQTKRIKLRLLDSLTNWPVINLLYSFRPIRDSHAFQAFSCRLHLLESDGDFHLYQKHNKLVHIDFQRNLLAYARYLRKSAG